MATVVAAKINGKALSIAARVATVTPDQSEATVQAAISAAAIGSTFVFGDGTYYASLDLNRYGVTFVAQTPGQVIITGARSQVETWANEGTDLYSCPMTYTPKTVMLLTATTRYQLLNYANLSEMVSRTMPAQSDYTGVSGVRTPGIGPVEGYVVTGGKLYVQFKAGQSPTTTSVRIARNNITSNLTISADNITIDGLRLHVADSACIQISNDVQRPTLRNIYGEGAKTLYRALGSGATVPTNGIFDSNNEFNGGRVYTWRVESRTKEFWDAAYSSNISTRYCRCNTRSILILNSYGYETFDGVEVKGFDTTSEPITCIVAYCVFDGVVDNHFEIEPWQQQIFMVVHHCLLKDGYVYLATAPFGGDRIEFRYNIIWHSLDAVGINDTDASPHKATWIKSLSHGVLDARVLQMLGIQHANNTMRIDGGAGGRLYVQGSTSQNEAAQQWAYDKALWAYNILDGGSGFVSEPWLLRSEPVPSGGTGTPSPAVGTARPGSGWALGTNIIRGGTVTPSHYQTDGTQYDTRPAVGQVTQTDPQWGTTPTTYFHPTNVAVNGYGAINVGGDWRFIGRPGPAWASWATMAHRRAWRSEVSKQYVNW